MLLVTALCELAGVALVRQLTGCKQRQRVSVCYVTGVVETPGTLPSVDGISISARVASRVRKTINKNEALVSVSVSVRVPVVSAVDVGIHASLFARHRDRISISARTETLFQGRLRK